jgi:hypothetical protein
MDEDRPFKLLLQVGGAVVGFVVVVLGLMYLLLLYLGGH